jgi:glutaredoxin 3
MAKVEIYTSPWCGYCARAKGLLEKKGAAYTEMDVIEDDAKRAEMRARSHRTTVPQIFINGQHIGGSDELVALESEGKLDALLAQPG